MKSSPPHGAATPGEPARGSGLASTPVAAFGAPGRPVEIEEATNRLLVHPLSRRLAAALAGTPITPNQVSMSSVLAAALGAGAYLWLAWPWSAFGGLAGFFAWHVLDGADGDLARRTGRTSTSGELVDGVCDHISQLLLYLAFALILARGLGWNAWVLAVMAGASHFAQSNAYETARKSYRRWVYGAAWMRQNAEAIAAMGPLRRALAGAYLGLSALADPGGRAVDAAMARAEATEGVQRPRALYGRLFAPQVEASAVLGGNARTIAAFASVLAGSPLWYFLFEIVALNLALCALLAWRRGRAEALCVALVEPDQAACAPN